MASKARAPSLLKCLFYARDPRTCTRRACRNGFRRPKALMQHISNVHGQELTEEQRSALGAVPRTSAKRGSGEKWCDYYGILFAATETVPSPFVSQSVPSTTKTSAPGTSRPTDMYATGGEQTAGDDGLDAVEHAPKIESPLLGVSHIPPLPPSASSLPTLPPPKLLAASTCKTDDLDAKVSLKLSIGSPDPETKPPRLYDAVVGRLGKRKWESDSDIQDQLVAEVKGPDSARRLDQIPQLRLEPAAESTTVAPKPERGEITAKLEDGAAQHVAAGNLVDVFLPSLPQPRAYSVFGAGVLGPNKGHSTEQVAKEQTFEAIMADIIGVME